MSEELLDHRERHTLHSELGAVVVAFPRWTIPQPEGEAFRFASEYAQIEGAIATALRLGDGTVRNYLTSVFTKLEVQNRTEAVALWLRSQRGGGADPY